MVDFSFPTGAEAAYRRPAVVASNDGANRSTTTLGRGVVTVVPVTGNVHGIYPFQVRPATRACCLLRDSKAQVEQIRAVTAERLHARLGRVPPPEVGVGSDPDEEARDGRIPTRDGRPAQGYLSGSAQSMPQKSHQRDPVKVKRMAPSFHRANALHT